jgi:energy-coupling factor transporter ATP-binding protein EcfA2
MSTEKIFVGREKEIAEFKAAITRNEGKLLLLIGQQGKGKSALLEELNGQLLVNGEMNCFSLIYKLNANDTSDAFLQRLMNDLLNIGGLTKGRLVLGIPGKPEQWKMLIKMASKLFPQMPPLGKPVEAIGDGLAALIVEDKRPVRERFLQFLVAVTKCLREEQRLVLIFDPDSCLDESVVDDWIALAGQIPERATIIFAQKK